MDEQDHSYIADILRRQIVDKALYCRQGLMAAIKAEEHEGNIPKDFNKLLGEIDQVLKIFNHKECEKHPTR